MEGNGQPHIPNALLLVQYPLVPIVQEANWAPELVWMFCRRKTYLAHVRTKPRITQSIASYFTHHATPTPKQLLINKIYRLLDGNIYKSAQKGTSS